MKNKLFIFILLISVIIFASSSCAPKNDFYIEDGVLKEYNSNETIVVIPDTCISIDSNTFQNYGIISEVVLQSSITRLGHNAFRNCSSLKKINIEYVTESIGSGVFFNCENLEDITFSDTIKTIEDSAFYNCVKLSSITIPSSIEHIGLGAFKGCINLTDIYYEGNKDKWSTLFSKLASREEFPSDSCIHFEVSDDNPQGNEAVRFKESVLVSNSDANDTDNSHIISSDLSIGQQNAIKQAKNYLNTMPFSRQGLIEQLEYEGYTNSDATYAVDHIIVDWNEQAAKKAKQYIDLMSFSKDGLIDQLKYDGFTAAQAQYGAKSVGY